MLWTLARLARSINLNLNYLGDPLFALWRREPLFLPRSEAPRRLYLEKCVRRARLVAEVSERPVPRTIIDKDGAPSAELIELCDQTGASLDFIFRGNGLVCSGPIVKPSEARGDG